MSDIAIGREQLTDFPNVLAPNRIATLLDGIRRLNKPAKLNRPWLESNGFKTKNDRALVPLMRSLGYIDGGGSPTAEYDRLRGTAAEARASVGRQMVKAYPEVFNNFAPAYVSAQLTKEELANFVRPKITAGDATVQNIVATFFALKARADLQQDGGGIADEREIEAGGAPLVLPKREVVSEPASALNVSISLSLEIPATSDADTYDKLFEAMARHLGSLLKRDRPE
jgi:hypothetical protein